MKSANRWRWMCLSHSFIRFVQTADSFRNEVNVSLYERAFDQWFTQFVQNADSFRNESPLCCSETPNNSAVGSIFIGKIEQNTTLSLKYNTISTS